MNLPCDVESHQNVGNFKARKFPCVEEVDNLSTVNTISCETIRMPRENRICIALFNTLHHLVENRTTWNFSRLFFYKLKGDVQIFSLGIVS